jgi:hypothetical protein
MYLLICYRKKEYPVQLSARLQNMLNFNHMFFTAYGSKVLFFFTI